MEEDMVRDLTVEHMEEIPMVLMGIITDLMSQPTMTSPMAEARLEEEDPTVDLTAQQALTPVDLTVLKEDLMVQQALTVLEDLTVVHTEQTLTLEMTTGIPLKRHRSWSKTSKPTLMITPLAPTLIHLTEEPTATVNLPPTTISTRPAPTMEDHPTQEDPLMEDLTRSMIKLPPTLATTPLTPTLVHLTEETTAMYLRLLSTTSMMEDHHTM